MARRVRCRRCVLSTDGRRVTPSPLTRHMGQYTQIRLRSLFKISYHACIYSDKQREGLQQIMSRAFETIPQDEVLIPVVVPGHNDDTALHSGTCHSTLPGMLVMRYFYCSLSRTIRQGQRDTRMYTRTHTQTTRSNQTSEHGGEKQQRRHANPQSDGKHPSLGWRKGLCPGNRKSPCVFNGCSSAARGDEIVQFSACCHTCNDARKHAANT